MEFGFPDVGTFHFIRPWWLAGLMIPALIWVLHRVYRADASRLDSLVDPHLQAAVIAQPPQQKTHPGRYILMLLTGLLSVALAGPSWERLPQPLHKLQQGRVVVLSLADSMDNTDLQPSRLQRAKFKLTELFKTSPGISTGLIAFAGEAFVVAPLSDDYDTINNLLDALDTRTLPVQGIRAQRGLEKAAELLKQVDIDAAEVILVADRASPLAVGAATALKQQDIQVSVLEIAPPGMPGHRELFKSIAKAGGGIYSRLSTDNSDVRRLNASLQTWFSRAKARSSESQSKADQWRDIGPYILLLVLLLASLLFRRGWLYLVLPYALPIGLALTSILPQPAQAFELESLWRRDDQTQWRAANAYRQQDYHSAMIGFEKDTSAKGRYNLANALAQSGQLEAALKTYDAALAMQPDFDDAIHNKEIVNAALDKKREQEQKARQEAEQNKQQNDEGEDGDNDEPGSQDGEDENEGENSQNQQPGESQDEKQLSGTSGRQAEQGMDMSVSEDEQSLQMMLRQVPDDPGALLRRKFARQYSEKLSREASQ